jgi:farnesyl-diphosphate farnesyltransferase
VRADETEILWSLLRDTSRSFYLTLRVLPVAVRFQIGLAYALARTADTIADTDLVPLDVRLQALQQLRERIVGIHSEPLGFSGLARNQGDPAERRLLEKTEVMLALLKTLAPLDLQLVSSVLNTITSGQELDLRRFAGASRDHVVPLQAVSDLDDYTWRVAGCVGEFWTSLCHSHLYSKDNVDLTALLERGVRFGKGLQLVNILRDLPRDLQQGRCYVPLELLEPARLRPQDLLDPAVMTRFRAVYQPLLDRAEEHLAEGWKYTVSLPRRSMRVKLACAWPVLIGQKTLARLREANVLDAGQRVKVNRSAVRGIMFRSVVLYPFRSAWAQLGQPATSPARPANTH